MKKTVISNKFLGYAVGMLLFLAGSCSSKIDFPSSSALPAAEVSAKVKEDKNNNYNIKLEAEHLADPGRLNPSRNVYVVWLESENNTSQNLGQLTAGGSKKASLETVTSYKPRRIFITAEDQADIDWPRGEVVFESDRISK
ncbi:MAG: hypothetical protein KFF73_01205 [Cyclobacteriaceae bacterium]|nr:hypothetical protein [Cyclobacteriaceae bacterium]